MTDNTVRTAVVTGAGSGLGRAIALQLAAEGRNIACVDLDGQAARDTATRVRERGRRRLTATGLLALIPPLRPLAGASS